MSFTQPKTNPITILSGIYQSEQYLKKVNIIVASNLELLESCIKQNLSTIDTKKKYDVTFACHGFKGLPSRDLEYYNYLEKLRFYQPNTFSRSGQIDEDEDEYIELEQYYNLTKLNYLKVKINTSLKKADSEDISTFTELANSKNIIPATVIGKNTYAIFHNNCDFKLPYVSWLKDEPYLGTVLIRMSNCNNDTVLERIKLSDFEHCFTKTKIVH